MTTPKNIDDVLQVISDKINSLSSFQVNRWRLEEKLRTSPITQQRSLTEQCDRAEIKYQTTLDDIRSTIIESGANDGENMDTLITRISSLAYEMASKEFNSD